MRGNTFLLKSKLMIFPDKIEVFLPACFLENVEKAADLADMIDPEKRVTTVWSLPMWRLFCEATGTENDCPFLHGSMIEVEESDNYYMFSTPLMRVKFLRGCSTF